jgi:hypothetical protein
MGTVILIGVLADQQFLRYRQRSAAQRSRLQTGASVPEAAE